MEPNKHGKRLLSAIIIASKTICITICMASILGKSANAAGHVNYTSEKHPNLPFSEAVKYNGVLYLSGNIGITSEGKIASGGIAAETIQTMDNIKNTLQKHQLGMRDLIKCSVFLTDINDWPAFNKVYASYFTKGTFPARSAMAISALALDAKVEVECMASTERQ